MPDCDCDEIQANINYYTAAVTVDQAALNVAQNQLTADQMQLYYWEFRAYQCNCGSPSSSSSGMSMSSMSSQSSLGGDQSRQAPSVFPSGKMMTPERFKTVLDGVLRMNDQYRELAAQMGRIQKPSV